MKMQSHAQLDEAFERIESAILPCLTMVLDSLLDAAAGAGYKDPKALAAELRMLASELDGLTQAVQRSVPGIATIERSLHVA